MVTSGVSNTTIPGVGTFFVGIDVVPGRYRCENGKGGWWVRFTGNGGDKPFGMWPLPPGPAEVDIDPADFAFETHVHGTWQLLREAAGSESPGRELRPVVDPTLRPELDRLVSLRRPLLRLTPMAAVSLSFFFAVMFPAWGVFLLFPLVLVAFVSRQMGEDAYRARSLRVRRNRYHTPEEFDDPSRELLHRAQAAVDAVLESEVHKEGLLDSVDNKVTLPQQEWEIGQVLARQTALRREQEQILAPGAEPEVEAALKPLRRKLDLSVEAVTRRVEALELYADRTRAADRAFRAHRQLEEISERSHAYDELLADSVRDDLAIPAIRRLSEQSEELTRTLRSRLEDAAEAAEAAGEAATELPEP
jgi:hypothetical protein